MKIKAYTNYNERSNTHSYREFDVIDALPEIGTTQSNGEVVKEINPISIDCEQGHDDVFYYDFYEIVSVWGEGNDERKYYVCIDTQLDETEVKYWYAVTEGTNCEDWDVGSFDLNEAIKIANDRERDTILVIDAGYRKDGTATKDAFCVEELHRGINF